MANKTLDDFKPFVHQDIQGVDIFTLERNLRFIIDDFCEKTWILQRGITHTVDIQDIEGDLFDSIIINTKGYYPYHRPFGIREFKINGIDWDLKYAEIINDTNFLDDIKGSGCKVYEIFSLYNIRIAPFTVSDEIYIKPVFKPIPDFTYVDERIYNDWVEAIAAGCKAKLLAIPNKPWTNMQSAGTWWALYRTKISEAKRKMRKDFTALSKSVYPREFGF